MPAASQNRVDDYVRRTDDRERFRATGQSSGNPKTSMTSMTKKMNDFDAQFKAASRR